METLVAAIPQSGSQRRGFAGVNCRVFEPVASPIPITPKSKPKPKPLLLRKDCDELCCSELWAGPAYSNSPPPSSLPIPKFSLRPKRSVSLDLPGALSPEFEIRRAVMSAPASPARSPTGGSFLTNAYATENLRRILNLDIE